ncbi:MAG: hypothetical protein ABSG73_13155 [Candidatus Aminicenantales bacterium]|jgi:hypothetical protein
MFKKYERIYEESKAAGTAYAVGYKKIALATWLFIFGLVVVWFKTLIGLGDNTKEIPYKAEKEIRR